MTARLLILAALAAALVACGGEDPKPARSGGPGAGRGPDAKTRKAMLDFAGCMREHGVDMPDPQFGEGGRVVQRSRGADPDTMRAAQRACQHFQDAIKPPEISEADKEKFKKEALANARCMREHGINMPDPQFDENGGATVRMGENGVDPDSEKFRAAQKACGGGMFGAKGGGG